MRVFVTGASGHIGSVVVRELLSAGHQVVGLARSDSSVAALRSAGAEVRRGNLDDLEGLREAAATADGVIHLAFKHDVAFTGDYAGAVMADLRAIEAMSAVLEGSGKPFVGTAGTLALAHAVLGRPGTEHDALAGGPRIDAENAVVALGKRGVRSSVIRLAPTVHSSLDHQGFVPSLITMARKNGFAAYVGDGANRWPALHTLDAARLYRLALEVAPAGSRIHGVAEEGIAFRDIAEAIGRGLGLPARSVSTEAASNYLGFLAAFAQLDNPTSSAHTRDLLDWQPTHPGLLADLAERHYFEPAPSA
ncbi:SDR family oxidoreductase [Myxococcus llanfairpwllgwyngyllgogerychwyrndrobwllllantysiliogogogochensis]|uniref:SDR family oxidoreductase n=1 Tax=Myxococcus llanfairpwllgwyngyllgogerychwyrndrobwllllantysiliogogogochensis TaxID=2590453 RepID=A0A540WP42_9BACT|nr:SDR family oxidoreductase [Myxococcus llanfairpwllgwyngyllgogerychwyrndrobwllllantysiliogogogochensis]TQF10793.1 SDR family oxidoreductase [Myxococcus llanfairpwllgwyngyllgogerychwyrndrobwllllantysiliogogogochensis]